MKPVIIIAIAVVCSVVVIMGLLFYDQQLQIDNIERQMNLENAIGSCSQYWKNVDNYEKCALKSFENWGTSEQLAGYRDSLKQAINQEISNEENFKRMELTCYQKHIGMLQDAKRCVEWAKREYHQYP